MLKIKKYLKIITHHDIEDNPLQMREFRAIPDNINNSGVELNLHFIL